MPNFLPRLHTPRVKFHRLTIFISQRSILLLVYLYQKDEGAYHRNLQKSTFSAFYFCPLRVNVFRLLNHPLLLPFFFSFFWGGGAHSYYIKNRPSSCPNSHHYHTNLTSWKLNITEFYCKVPSIHNNWIAVVVLQLVNQATCFGRFIRPSSGLQNNIVN